MSNVPERPPGANGTVPPAHRVDLGNPSERAAWLADACEQTADIIAAARDVTAPPGARMLGRRAAREQVDEAAGALTALFAAVGLDIDMPPSALARSLDRTPR